MTPDWLDVTAYAIALPIAVILTVHGLDDLMVDVLYYLGGLWRRANPPLTLNALRAKSPQRIAMMVAAWHEAPVIARMLENALTTLDYDPDCFDIFVGTYPNDPETRQQVMAIVARAPNVHEVVVPHDGPTSKADCLNAVHRGMKRIEAERGVPFQILLVHDAEDVIHPLALRHYNYRIPEYDFVQTPVLPLEIPLHRLVGGTYLDEFTEHHLKDLIVRGRIGGLVPSAGVGSAFARSAFEEIALGHREEAFDTESLTEDYEIGIKFRLAGKKTFFACDTVEHDSDDARNPSRSLIATREFFPTALAASIRQRSRWILGIGFQTWEKVGWKGSLPVLYSLYRDRRALLSHFVAIAAYAVVVYCGLRWVHGLLFSAPWSLDRVFVPDTMLFWLVWINSGFLGWRAAVKIATLKRVYGWPQSLMSVARFPVANLVSFLATVSAARQYVVHKITKRPLRWKKTEHEFPDIEPLRPFRQRLGSILRTREGLREEDLRRALHLHAASGHRLGEVLEEIGVMSGAQIDRALARQCALPAAAFDPEGIPPRLLSAIGEAEAADLGVLPIFEDKAGWIVVASSQPGTSELESQLAHRFGRRVRLAYCGRRRMEYARRRAYRRLRRDGVGAPRERLGERLVLAGVVDEPTVQRALDESRRTSEHLAEVLLRWQIVDAPTIARLALSPLHDRLVEVAADAVDLSALRRLGYAACAFHDFVPLAPTRRGRPIVSTHPLHPLTVSAIQARLACDLRMLIAPRWQVRSARMLAARAAWPRGISHGAISIDAAELAALFVANVPPASVERLALDARSLGKPPIAVAIERGFLSPDEGCRLLAAVYLVKATEDLLAHRTGWLPPEIESRDAPRIVGVAEGELVLSMTAPDAKLARELRALYPERALGWRVHPVGSPDAPAK